MQWSEGTVRRAKRKLERVETYLRALERPLVPWRIPLPKARSNLDMLFSLGGSSSEAGGRPRTRLELASNQLLNC